MKLSTVNARISPRGGLDVLSRQEVGRLRDASVGGQHELLRRCALAVLTTGSHSDDPRAMRELYPDFDIEVLQHDRGIRLDLQNAPATAFVDGRIIEGVAELLFAVVRDIAYVASEVMSFDNTASTEPQSAAGQARSAEASERPSFDLKSSEGITNAVFEILRNARVLRANVEPNLVVCWGGHSISRGEYDYTKAVGYELGLRGMDICTGCGPGAMKGPMKGATIAHSKQRREENYYIGVTEPGIIAAESPNPIVNRLVIMPDIEKRLEAFVRMGHAIVVFPGGVGTAEEILYLLGILLHPDNAGLPFPLVLTGPQNAAAYFEQIDHFLKLTLGEQAAERYRIIVDDPTEVACELRRGLERVRKHRLETRDAFFYNWTLQIRDDFQRPFLPSHENVANLKLHREQPVHCLAADLRRAFSAIVAGNVKEEGIRRIEEHGPFEIHGDPEIMRALDALLRSFVVQQRMKLEGEYRPCYRVVA